MAKKHRQPDLFDTYRQGDLFDRPRVSERPSTDYVRARMAKILDEARSAASTPWDNNTAKVYETIFPQMSKWLPEDEAASLVGDFMTELERLRSRV